MSFAGDYARRVLRKLDEDELIDLEPVLRDAVVLDLPFTPLCRPDSPGCAPNVEPTSTETRTTAMQSPSIPDGPAWGSGRDR